MAQNVIVKLRCLIAIRHVGVALAFFKVLAKVRGTGDNTRYDYVQSEKEIILSYKT